MFSLQTVLKCNLELYSSCLFYCSFKLTYQAACLVPFKLNVTSQAIQTGKLNTKHKEYTQANTSWRNVFQYLQAF